MSDHYLLQFFKFDHLPVGLQLISKPFGTLASMINGLPDNPEKTTAIRKLLEAKDCAVRATLYRDPTIIAELEKG